jgi:hypothetical protein
MGVNANPGLRVTGVIACAGMGTNCQLAKPGAKQKPRTRRGSEEADSVKLGFEFSANNSGQTNQASSQQSQRAGLGNAGGDHGVAAGEGY